MVGLLPDVPVVLGRPEAETSLPALALIEDVIELIEPFEHGISIFRADKLLERRPARSTISVPLNLDGSVTDQHDVNERRKERSRWHSETLRFVGFSVAVLAAIIAVGRFLGPATFAFPLMIPFFYAWRYRAILHDYAHHTVTLESYTGTRPRDLDNRIDELQSLGFGDPSILNVHTNGSLLDHKPLATLRSSNALVEATLLRKRIGLVSALSDERWLITVNRPFIRHPRFVSQVLRNAKITDLLAAHEHALTKLADTHGLEAEPVIGADTQLIELEQGQLRQHFADGHGVFTLSQLYDFGKSPNELLVQ